MYDCINNRVITVCTVYGTLVLPPVNLHNAAPTLVAAMLLGPTCICKSGKGTTEGGHIYPTLPQMNTRHADYVAPVMTSMSSDYAKK